MKNDLDHRQIHITDFGIVFAIALMNPTGGYTTVAGCAEYVAPEVYHHKNINPTPMSDMWTVGIIGYEMCLGEEVTWTTGSFQEIKNYMLTGQTLNLRHIPARFGPTVHQIISMCMAIDPTERFTAAGLSKFVKDNLAIVNTDTS
jgi:serine/threonine protein kinase